MTDDVLVVGAGPGGLAAAIQSRRHGLSVRLCECARPGGLLWNAHRVENYPGFPDGIPGPDLARAFLRQADAAGVSITAEEILKLDWEDGLFQAHTATATYAAKAVVVASGTRPRPMAGIRIPETLRERVAYEIAELLPLSGKRIIVVGGGDAAFDYALNLGQNNSVTIVNRGEEVKGLALLKERAQACPKIDYRPGTIVRALKVRPGGGIAAECSDPHGSFILRADYLVGAVGREPRRAFISVSLLKRSSTLERRGIFHFVGDVKNGIFRQTAIAVGEGIRAGMGTAQALKELSDEGDGLNRKGRHRPRLHRRV